MEKTKLTIRIPTKLATNVKRFAAEQNTTVTALIETFLRRLPSDLNLDEAPIVKALSGTLSQDVSVEDHRKHLEKKYGQKD